ncbi:ankyrin repeat-containing domain protein [Apiospora kogelbergensis]|uniref:Ankyrin repeat-containing domain protein n=1 Tax=Apiospora kogelbergensis TaxID=1337665 RepID=A0AAW0QAZ7_9PEZI
MLLTTGQVDPDARDNNGRTPLSWAASGDYVDGIRILLETGRVDPDTRDNNGRTPLSWAVEFERLDGMMILLETGRVDPDARDNNGRTPLSWASTANYDWIDNDPLKLLLQIGRDDANFKGMSGRSTLSYANNCVERTECAEARLPNSVVDVNSRDDKGRTPLFWAVDCRRVEHMDALLETGLADIATMDDYGTNLLQLATFKGDEAMVEVLLDWGAPEGPDFYGLQALFGDA